MFCPQCGDEFRPGFTECPDCMVSLVRELPSEEDETAVLVEVARYDTPDEAVNAREALEAEGISAIVPEPPEPGSLLMSSGTPARAPVPVLVLKENRERAVEILKGGAGPAGPSDRPRRSIPRPAPDEYAPEAARYMALVPDDGRVLDHLAANVSDTEVLALSIGDDALERPYGPGKWTGKELLVHVIDDERIYAYRALRFARGDQTELPGFEEKDYARTSRANDRRIADILRELLAVRQATVELFDGLDDEALTRIGVANGHPMSVRAAAYHIAGHELHHRRILEESYG